MSNEDRLEYHRAVVIVPIREMHKFGMGVVLPVGYRLADLPPTYLPTTLSQAIIVESWDLPRTPDGLEPPRLRTLPGYQGIVVEPWREV